MTLLKPIPNQDKWMNLKKTAFQTIVIDNSIFMIPNKSKYQKKTFFFLLLLFVLLFLIECSHTQHEGKVNKHMHKTSTKDLIEMFESPERDAFQEPDQVIRFIGNINGKKILDIGTGSGYFSFRFARKGANVIAGDVNDEFLSHIEKRKTEENYKPGSIETRKLYYDSPNLNKQEVDIVFICNVFHHIDNRISYLEKIRNGLKPAGKVVIVDFPKNDTAIPFGGPPMDMRVSESEAKLELEKAGFKVTRMDTKILPYQYLLEAKL